MSGVPSDWELLPLASKLNWLTRVEVEGILTGIGIQCYENESTDELREAILCNIEDGTLSASVVEETF